MIFAEQEIKRGGDSGWTTDGLYVWIIFGEIRLRFEPQLL
jgi:uncharacterized protein YfaQ (DUF2300 family)